MRGHWKTQGTDFGGFSKENGSLELHTYRKCHWYMYLHLVDFYGKLLGIYTIHGSYKIVIIEMRKNTL